VNNRSPLREGGYLLTACEDHSILLSECGFSLVASRLANLYDHKIVPPFVSGVNFFYCRLVQFTQRSAVELQHFLGSNHSAIGGTLVARDSDTLENHSGSSPCLAGNRIFHHHRFSIHFFLSFLFGFYQRFSTAQPPLMGAGSQSVGSGRYSRIGVQCSRQQAQKSNPRTSSPQQSEVIISTILIVNSLSCRCIIPNFFDLSIPTLGGLSLFLGLILPPLFYKPNVIVNFTVSIIFLVIVSVIRTNSRNGNVVFFIGTERTVGTKLSHLSFSLSYILYSASSVPKPENIFVCFSRGKRYMPYRQMYLLAGAGLRYRKKSGVPCRKCLYCNGLRRGSRYPLKVSRILPVWQVGVWHEICCGNSS
jgi:hypothetical protein